MTTRSKLPLHFWLISALTLLWNGFGTVDYVLTQTRNAAYLANFTAEQRAHFESMPSWVEGAWAVGVWGALAGSALLLLRNKHAVTAFAASLAGLALSSVWQFLLAPASASSVMTSGNLIMFAVIWAAAIALLAYAWWQGQLGRLH